MYIQKFWLINNKFEQVFSIDFTNSNNQIKKWNCISNEQFDNLLIFKLISLCLGGDAIYKSLVGDEIEKKLALDGNCLYWGVNLLNDKRKTIQIVFEYQRGRGIENLRSNFRFQEQIPLRKCYNDFKLLFGSFAYGYNSLTKQTLLNENPYFIPRKRCTRFEAFFNNHFETTNPN